MSKHFLNTHLLLEHVPIDSVFVEIGSDRYEGSTAYFADLAATFNTVLHSIDISNAAQARVRHANIVWHTSKGSDWAKNVYPNINKKISILYLDNFDWIWDLENMQSFNLEQAAWYKENFNIRLSNDACQQEHFNQTNSLLPWLDKDSLVICDDTYQEKSVWTGKCGPTVVLLKSHGFSIVDKSNYAVTLQRK